MNYIDTGVILAVVIINAIIGFTQEIKAEESVRALKQLVVPGRRVIRDGHEQEVDATGLVLGDLVTVGFRSTGAGRSATIAGPMNCE